MDYYNRPEHIGAGAPEPYQPPWFGMAAPAYAAGNYLYNRARNYFRGSGRARSSASRFGKRTFSRKGGNNGVQQRGVHFEKSKRRQSTSKRRIQKLANKIEIAQTARNLVPI